ncbi:MAG TPA: PhzF family phenazine biosynthesis protein [Ktedonobacterales bacterium]|nr:PhzF family phenazine biosynthesis protein [Ktedonobacterales bacterium]
MRRYRFLQLDVFTGQPFGGNQLAVFLEADGLTDEEMQAIAAEMNFSETTFVLPASEARALRRVRIFTSSAELPFAGHPVVGTTFALAHASVIHAGEASPIYLQLGIGTLPVDVLYDEQTLSFVWMHQPVPRFTPWQGDRAKLAAAVGLAGTDIAPNLPIMHGSAGVPFLYVPLRSLAALGRARPATDLAVHLENPEPHIGVYLFTLATGAEGIGARSRMFAPGMGVVEDAATGSAAGPLGVYLLRHGRLTPDSDGESRLRVEQGVEMKRPSRIEVAIEGSAEAVRDVRVGGEAIVVAEAELILPNH